MEIIEKSPNRWSRQLFCTGRVHTSYGCGSLLAVEVSDLFYIYMSEDRHPVRLVAFQCPVCGLVTRVAQEGSKDWNQWFDNLQTRSFLEEDRLRQSAERLTSLQQEFDSFVRRCKARDKESFGRGSKPELTQDKSGAKRKKVPKKDVPSGLLISDRELKKLVRRKWKSR